MRGGVDMDENKMGWREYARYAEMSIASEMLV